MVVSVFAVREQEFLSSCHEGQQHYVVTYGSLAGRLVILGALSF